MDAATEEVWETVDEPVDSTERAEGNVWPSAPAPPSPGALPATTPVKESKVAAEAEAAAAPFVSLVSAVVAVVIASADAKAATEADAESVSSPSLSAGVAVRCTNSMRSWSARVTSERSWARSWSNVGSPLLSATALDRSRRAVAPEDAPEVAPEVAPEDEGRPWGPSLRIRGPTCSRT